jgi:hypothetical protein
MKEVDDREYYILQRYKDIQFAKSALDSLDRQRKRVVREIEDRERRLKDYVTGLEDLIKQIQLHRGNTLLALEDMHSIDPSMQSLISNPIKGLNDGRQ